MGPAEVRAIVTVGVIFLLAALYSGVVFYVGFRIGQLTVRPIIKTPSPEADTDRQLRRDMLRQGFGLNYARERAGDAGFVPVTARMRRAVREAEGFGGPDEDDDA
jgi:hypothetical protein